MAMNNTDDADDGGKYFVVHGIRKMPQQSAAKMPMNERILFWRVGNQRDRIISGVEKALCRIGRMLQIPGVSGFNLAACELPNAKPTHLPMFLG